MRFVNELGSRIIAAVQDRALNKQLTVPGPTGDFYRMGGNKRLFDDLSLSQEDVVMVEMFALRSQIDLDIAQRFACRQLSKSERQKADPDS